MPVDLLVCRKCKGSAALVARVERRLADREPPEPGRRPPEVHVHLVRCQDICNGAVAGVEVDGELTWFCRLRGKKAARALAKLAGRGGTGPVPGRLEGYHLAWRDGRPAKR